MESPFHAVVDETGAPLRRYNADHPARTITALSVGHGGYVFESGMDVRRWSNDLLVILVPWLDRGGKPRPLSCRRLERAEEAMTWILVDHYARALELGFQDYHWAWHDSDLAELTEDPRFRELLDRYASHER